MGYKIINNAISIVRNIVNDYVKPGFIALDCTIGNGNDTLLLRKSVGDSGKVYGFDIQEIAIKNTSKLLYKHKLDNRVILINDSHEHIDKYISEQLDIIIYNLGYLPKGDKSIKTKPKSTLESIYKSLQLLKENGIILITSYIGHEGGLLEKQALENFLLQLDQTRFNVLKHEFINQKNNPPILYIIEKSAN
ncbi:tRNA (mnm(5)s(2)U34)-methyltransferase [Wansuia hejianensis]|uniref:tRNA (mnm(5)s(2)U34)-methyltransferase n=1 Tax=Wansuia hejianensis TaxID=2763667 RepID=UPI0020164181|nr:class I SAM-dependent methyltransferase [Wansuia hejianensis]